jgi:hypothetical protein
MNPFLGFPAAGAHQEWLLMAAASTANAVALTEASGG